VGEFREDGSYVVSRRGASSSGNSKVFERFEALRDLYESLPERFTADHVERAGITGSRRHLLIRHLCEHSAFDCHVECQNPLTAVKHEFGGET
jgi:hypothetical protein